MFEPNRHRSDGRSHHHDPRREPGGGPRRGPSGAPFSLRDFLGRGGFGPAVRRGEIRPLILAVLLQKPMHGYEVIQELEARSGGRWRPSAGSVYPTLQLLADEGLVTSEEIDGRRTFTLTDSGRTAAETATIRSPWTQIDEDGGLDIRKLAVELAGAVMQVQRMGSPKARLEAQRVLTDARRRMYRLLADDEEATAADGDPMAGGGEPDGE